MLFLLWKPLTFHVVSTEKTERQKLNFGIAVGESVVLKLLRIIFQYNVSAQK